MVSFLLSMPAGIPGDVNRAFHSVIEPASYTPTGTTGAPTAYGIPVVIENGFNNTTNTGNVRSIVVAYDGQYPSIYGILVRPFPTGGAQDALGAATTMPLSLGVCDVCRMGYVSVLLSGTAAAVKGSQVYIWYTTATGTHIVGGFEASTTASSTIPLLGATFMGPADASGNTEISFNLLSAYDPPQGNLQSSATNIA